MPDSLNPQLVFASGAILPFILDTPGPVDFNGARYVASQASPTSFTPTKLRMFKSTDSGLTFVEQDSANAATIQSGGSPNQAEGVGQFYPGFGNTVYFCYCDGATSNLTLRTYNMATDTWGTPIGGGPNIATTPPDAVLLFRRSDASFVVLYQVTGSSPLHQCSWIVYNAGWGTPHNISLVHGTYNIFLSALLTTHDRVCFLITELGSGNNGHIFYGNISSTNTATTGTDTGIGWGGNAQNLAWGAYLPAQDTAVFPQSTFDSNGSGSTPQGGVIKAATTEGSVSFSYETVNIAQFLDPSNGGLSTIVVRSPDGTTLRFFWLTHSLTVPAGNNIYYATQAVGTTSWSASTLLWNYVANPLNPTPPITGVEPVMTLSWGADNQIGIVLAGWVDVSATNFCDIEYYLSVQGPTPIPPLSPTCPTTNTGVVGQLYTGTIGVSGGVPPYHFALAPLNWGSSDPITWDSTDLTWDGTAPPPP